MKDESRQLQEAMRVMKEQGLEIIYKPDGPIENTYRVSMYPVFLCPDCKYISAPRTYCVWCHDAPS
jgi:hypothetical protein